MRISNSGAVGSPTARVVAVMAAVTDVDEIVIGTPVVAKVAATVTVIVTVIATVTARRLDWRRCPANRLSF